METVIDLELRISMIFILITSCSVCVLSHFIAVYHKSGKVSINSCGMGDLLLRGPIKAGNMLF